MTFIHVFFSLGIFLGAATEVPRPEGGFLRTSDSAKTTVWEAVIPEDIRVVKMALGPSAADSYVVIAVGRTRPITTVFAVKSQVIERSNVRIAAVGISTTDNLTVLGKRQGVGGDARLVGKIELRDQLGKALNHWNATFVDVEGGFLKLTEMLSAASSKALQEVARSRESARSGGSKEAAFPPGDGVH